MQTLVTGANGLLGTHLVRTLLAAGYAVKAFVRKGSKYHSLSGLKVEIVHGDVRDGTALRHAAEGCEVVYHAAAVHTYSNYSRDDMETTAREGARNVVEAAHSAKVRRLVLTSSVVTLGSNASAATLDESAQLDEANAPHYFVCKAIEERVALARARELKVSMVVANPAAFMGVCEGRSSPSNGTVTGYLLDPLRLTYSGGLNLAHVHDIAVGHLLLADKGQPLERYILGGENCTWDYLHRTIAEICGVAGPRMQVGRTLAYAGGAIMELVAMITGRPTLASRSLATQVGRYLWYSQGKAEALGYSARSARQTLLDTIPAIIARGELPASVRNKLSAADATKI